MLTDKVDGIVRLPSRLRAPQLRGGDASVQMLVNGIDGNTRPDHRGLRRGARSPSPAPGPPPKGRRRAGAGGRPSSKASSGSTAPTTAAISWCPGLIVLIMTLIGAFLTSMVVAREWERGTFEALFVTPVRTDEILISKIVPYFVLGMGGLALCMLARSSCLTCRSAARFVVLMGVSMLYLLVSVGHRSADSSA